MPQTKTTKVTKSPKALFETKKSQKPKIDALKKTQVGVKKESAPAKKLGGLTVNVYDINGKSVSTISLPKEIFGGKPNKNLLAQAIHIYEANAKPSTAHTKTRGEVRGGGAKPWKQKGTGNARAGSRRSPLWVGGGITFGPRTKDVRLTLPAKMRHSALLCALSAKRESDGIKVVKNLEKISPKTKIIANLLLKLETKGSTLFITSGKNENMKLATRNIQKVAVNAPQNLNAYEVLKARNLLISEEAIEKFK